MAASVTLWGAVKTPPPVAYADANYLLLLYRAAYPTSSPCPRAAAARKLYEQMGAAGCELWTTPMSIEEGAWSWIRQVLESEKRGGGHSGISLSDFKRRYPSQYKHALSVAQRVGTRFIAFILSETATSIRWPQTATGEAVSARACVHLARLLLRRYGVESADALHAACARWDHPSGNPACVISDDRQYQLIDGLNVFAYGHI